MFYYVIFFSNLCLFLGNRRLKNIYSFITHLQNRKKTCAYVHLYWSSYFVSVQKKDLQIYVKLYIWVYNFNPQTDVQS